MTNKPARNTDARKAGQHAAHSGPPRAFGDTLSVVVAGVLCATLLVSTGVGYRAVRDKLQRSDAPALPAGTLAPLPLQLGEWHGRDVPLRESVIRAADVDDHISRIYSRSRETAPLNVFIALGRRARDLMPHRPEVCYPGAGFTLRKRAVEKHPLADGSALEATIYTFGRGDFGGRPLVVLNFFIVDGEVCRDVSLLRSKAWRGQSTIRYMAQVQLVTAIDSDLADAAARIAMKDFLDQLVPPLRQLLAQAETTAGDLP